MRALVTGGAGLIGSHISDLIYKNGYKVRVLDNLDPETHPKKPDWISKKYEFVRGDVRNKKILEQALRGVDLIFHQAAFGGFTSEFGKYIQVNSIGTSNIFEVIKEKKLKIKKIVVASSQGIYGEGKYSCSNHGIIEPGLRTIAQLNKRQWELRCPECRKILIPIAADENKIPKPGTIYSITKLNEEQIALQLGSWLGIPTVCLRYAVTYGPRQSIFNPYTGVVSIFSTRILNNLSPVIYEDGQQTRDFVFVEDVARANLLVSQTKAADFQVFNISTGRPTSVLGLVDLLNKAYGTQVKALLKDEFRPGEVRHLLLDNSKICKLGWQPQVQLQEGIGKYVDWIREQGSIKEFWAKAYKNMKRTRVVLKVQK